MSVMSEITAFSRGLSPVSPYMHSIPGLNKGWLLPSFKIIFNSLEGDCR